MLSGTWRSGHQTGHRRNLIGGPVFSAKPDRCFSHCGKPELYLASADWMNRNLYHRVEVCFPIYDSGLKKELLQRLDLQLQDTVKACQLDKQGHNQPIATAVIDPRFVPNQSYTTG